jgi:hypothetical protein
MLQLSLEPLYFLDVFGRLIQRVSNIYERMTHCRYSVGAVSNVLVLLQFALILFGHANGAVALA